MPRKYYSAKEINEMMNAEKERKRILKELKELKRGGGRSEEATMKRQTAKWKTERKESVKGAQERYEKKASKVLAERMESEPKADSPAYEKELEKAQKTAKRKLLIAKLKRSYQRVSPHGTYVSKLAERAAFGSFQKAYTSKQPTHQLTKNIRPKKVLLKTVSRLFPTPKIERGVPSWVTNRPPIDILGAKNIFMNKEQRNLIRGSTDNLKRKNNNNSLFWR